ncbi:MAG: hypothetical protein V3V19_11400 [Cocleimonas sp.]
MEQLTNTLTEQITLDELLGVLQYYKASDDVTNILQIQYRFEGIIKQANFNIMKLKGPEYNDRKDYIELINKNELVIKKTNLLLDFVKSYAELMVSEF